jgi:hypothetical protein
LVRFGAPNGDQLPDLCEGERVILWEPGLEVEATIIFDAAARYWMAKPAAATWRDIPISSEEEAHLKRA